MDISVLNELHSLEILVLSAREADGKMYRPDVKTTSNDLMEYKPLTKRGIARGRAAKKVYEKQLGLKTRIIYYKP